MSHYANMPQGLKVLEFTLPSMDVVSNSIWVLIVPFDNTIIGVSNKPEAHRMNGKLLYNAIRRLVGHDIHGNNRLPKRCPHDVENYMGTKPFWSHPPTSPNPNPNTSKLVSAIISSTCETCTILRAQFDKAL